MQGFNDTSRRSIAAQTFLILLLLLAFRISAVTAILFGVMRDFEDIFAIARFSYSNHSNRVCLSIQFNIALILNRGIQLFVIVYPIPHRFNWNIFRLHPTILALVPLRIFHTSLIPPKNLFQVLHVVYLVLDSEFVSLIEPSDAVPDRDRHAFIETTILVGESGMSHGI